MPSRQSQPAPRSIPTGSSTPGEQPAPPEQLVRTCLNCGAPMEERKCKLFCRCGYYASCSDFL
jgi:hypothetical protein